MRKELLKILVTGGAGFIGSAFVRLLVKKGFCPVVCDKLTYAADLARLKMTEGRFKFYKADICSSNKLEQIFKNERPEIVVHFAAETHVDRSIRDSRSFLQTNVLGTQVLLDCARRHCVKKFIHISTDEVYGDIKKGEFGEDSPLKPNSPYASSKAAADLLIKSYIRTYNFPGLIVRPCNNYGPWQYPEKLIPLAILKVLRNEKIPLYARGKNVREWLYVDDTAKAILRILKNGRPGEVYNLGSEFEKRNIEVVRMLLKIMRRDPKGFEFVADRPGHDFRYSLNSSKLKKHLRWQPSVPFSHGLKKTVSWGLNNREWLLKKWKNISPLYRKR